MKKLLLLTLVFTVLFGSVSFASVTDFSTSTGQSVVVKHNKNLFQKVKSSITQKVQEVKKTIKALKNYGGTLRTAILLMVVGLIIAILGSSMHIEIVWAVGVIFFLIGALFLLLYLI